MIRPSGTSDRRGERRRVRKGVGTIRTCKTGVGSKRRIERWRGKKSKGKGEKGVEKKKKGGGGRKTSWDDAANQAATRDEKGVEIKNKRTIGCWGGVWISIDNRHHGRRAEGTYMRGRKTLQENNPVGGVKGKRGPQGEGRRKGSGGRRGNRTGKHWPDKLWGGGGGTRRGDVVKKEGGGKGG